MRVDLPDAPRTVPVPDGLALRLADGELHGVGDPDRDRSSSSFELFEPSASWYSKTI